MALVPAAACTVCSARRVHYTAAMPPRTTGQGPAHPGPDASSPGSDPARRTLLRWLSSLPLALAGWQGTWARAGTTAGWTKGGPAAGIFPLADVRLRPGHFLDAQRRDLAVLLALDPDRLLHAFRRNAGLAPRAPIYRGWESEEPWVGIRCHGHTLGHYLAACAQMHAASGDGACLQRIDYVAGELAACQAARGDGLLCAFPDGDAPLLDSLAGREFAGVPWYTLHKVMAGLRDAHLHAASATARTVLLRLADWIEAACRDVPDERLQRMLDVEHGGMNELLADVHVLSGEPRYLALARRWSHRALLEPLARGEDPLDGLHANTQIPKVIGFARLHELTGDAGYGRAAQAFWSTVTARRSFATGGHGDLEHFFPVDEFAQRLGSAKTMETCCTHNMLRLTQSLFRAAPRAEWVDYAERALYNGILASQDPDSGMVTYFQATRPGYPKLYSTPERSFWCCFGTGLENHARYGEWAYAQRDDALYVNLFMATSLDWRARGVRLVQETGFPEQPRTSLRLACARPTRFALRIRRPAWCAAPTVRVNGRALHAPLADDGYLELRRTWRDGDRVDVELPMSLRCEQLPGSAGIAALMYGPIVLAGRLGSEGIGPGDDQLANERRSGEVLDLPTPLPVLAPADAAAGPPGIAGLAIEGPGPGLAFRARCEGMAAAVELVPFHRIAHERYTLYWRIA